MWPALQTNGIKGRYTNYIQRGVQCGIAENKFINMIFSFMVYWILFYKKNLHILFKEIFFTFLGVLKTKVFVSILGNFLKILLCLRGCIYERHFHWVVKYANFSVSPEGKMPQGSNLHQNKAYSKTNSAVYVTQFIYYVP